MRQGELWSNDLFKKFSIFNILITIIFYDMCYYWGIEKNYIIIGEEGEVNKKEARNNKDTVYI